MSTERRLRLGWLTPENCTLPPGASRGSIANDIWQLASRLKDDVDVLLATQPHPSLGTAPVTVDGIRYVRARDLRDDLRAVAVHRLNQVQRRLGLPDLPYAGREAYFRGYARRHAASFALEDRDLVHFHNNSQWAPVLRRALPRARIVLQMHCEWLVEIPEARGRERLAAVDRVLCVSEHVAGQVRERYPEQAGKVAVLHNGIDAVQFPPVELVRATHADEVAELRRRLGLGDGPLVLFVGRVSAEKGLHVLLEALPRVLARVPAAQVLIAGRLAGLRSPLPTRERSELAEHPEWRAWYGPHIVGLARAFGGRVVVPGPVPTAELPLLYALADVYVQPSRFEAFPLSVLEAMASGLPVVASAVGGMPEQVADGETGLLVPFGDAGALADALVRLLTDPALARRLGRAGRTRALRRFTWDESADRLLEEYERLTGRSERGVRAAAAARALPV